MAKSATRYLYSQDLYSLMGYGYPQSSSEQYYKKNPVKMVAAGKGLSHKLSAIAADEERRRTFARNSVQFLRTNKLGGINLSWHRPGFPLGSTDDRVNYILLLQALREEFEQESRATGKNSLLISIDVPHDPKVLDERFDIHSLSKYLDFMNVFAFNYRIPVETETSQFAPLYSSGLNDKSQSNIDFTVKYYLGLGVDREKLILGVPTYGRSLVIYGSEEHISDLHLEDGFGLEEHLSKAEGSLPYFEICSLLKSGNLQIENPSSPFGVTARHNNYFVGFEDINSVKLKAKYAAQEDLGGLMFWAIDYDDFRGDCHAKKFPLIESGKEALLASVVQEFKSSNNVQEEPLRFTYTSSTNAIPERIVNSNFTHTTENNVAEPPMKRSALSDDGEGPNSSESPDRSDGERQRILDQLIDLVKRIGGVSVLERLLIAPARTLNRSPLITNLETYTSDYGPTVTSLTVTSPPLFLKKAPTPIVLTNFTINIDKINIDSGVLGRPLPN
ncbi:hypothetical protein J6590_035998 [Homalodisca vitripennis]|nr:hypothetical protein J6590_035998 [Homalodisca vitripennis]